MKETRGSLGADSTLALRLCQHSHWDSWIQAAVISLNYVLLCPARPNTITRLHTRVQFMTNALKHQFREERGKKAPNTYNVYT